MPKKLILIEDDNNLRDSITLILERAGYLVTAQDSILNAHDILRSGEYQLVISDNDLRQLNEFLQPNGSVSRIPILIISDHYYSEVIEADKQINVTYLDKPNAPENLLDCISKILDNAYH